MAIPFAKPPEPPQKPDSEETEQAEVLEPNPEKIRVRNWRFREALSYGWSLVGARLYADSDLDAGELRRLVKLGYTAEQQEKLLL